MTAPALRLLSAVPGRARWLCEALRGHAAAADYVSAELARCAGVTAVEASSLTGSVLVLFDEPASSEVVAAHLARLIREALGTALERAPAAGAPPRSATLAGLSALFARGAASLQRPSPAPGGGPAGDASLRGARRLSEELAADVRPVWPLLAKAVALDVGANVVGSLRATSIGAGIDAAVAPEEEAGPLGPRGAMAAAGLVGVTATGLRGWLRYRSQLAWGSAAAAFQQSLRLRLFAQAGRLEMPYLLAHPRAEVLAVLGDDVGQIERAWEAAWSLGDIVVNSSVLFTIIFVRSPAMGVVSLLPLPVLLALSRGFHPRIQRAIAAARARSGQLFEQMSDSVAGIPVTKAFAAEDREIERLASAAAEYGRALEAAGRPIVGFPIVLDGAAVSMTILANLALGKFLLTPEATMGDVAVITQSLSGLFFPLLHLGPLVDVLTRGLHAYDRVLALLEAPVEEDDDLAELPERVEGEIVYRDVRFSYPNAAAPLFEGLSLTFAAHRTTGVVGATGSGKSTLIALLLRFYAPGSGAIALDGRDLAALRRSALRRAIAVVSQDVFLFNRTVLENIGIGRPGARFDDIVAAAKIAEAHEFICGLPQGYDTVLGEGAGRLSGGERQRLAIARAILKDAPVLVFDEATSSLDSNTEVQLQRALHSFARGRTIIKIAHRLATVRDADWIYVLDHGRVVEEGTHDELTARDGQYALLWRSQLGEP